MSNQGINLALIQQYLRENAWRSSLIRTLHRKRCPARDAVEWTRTALIDAPSNGGSGGSAAFRTAVPVATTASTPLSRSDKVGHGSSARVQGRMAWQCGRTVSIRCLPPSVLCSNLATECRVNSSRSQSPTPKTPSNLGVSPHGLEPFGPLT